MLQGPSLPCCCALQRRSGKDWNLHTDWYGVEQDDERWAVSVALWLVDFAIEKMVMVLTIIFINHCTSICRLNKVVHQVFSVTSFVAQKDFQFGESFNLGWWFPGWWLGHVVFFRQRIEISTPHRQSWFVVVSRKSLGNLSETLEINHVIDQHLFQEGVVMLTVASCYGLFNPPGWTQYVRHWGQY